MDDDFEVARLRLRMRPETLRQDLVDRLESRADFRDLEAIETSGCGDAARNAVALRILAAALRNVGDDDVGLTRLVRLWARVSEVGDPANANEAENEFLRVYRFQEPEDRDPRSFLVRLAKAIERAL